LNARRENLNKTSKSYSQTNPMNDTEGEKATCPGTNRHGEACGHPAGWGTDDDTGPCKFHGGAAGAGRGAPDGNGNAEKHGLKSDRENWFDRHRDSAGELVRALVASYVADAPFGWESTAKVDQLCEVAIDQARLRHANEYLDEFLTEQVVGVTEQGREITELEENPAHMPRDRIKRTNAKILKDLGIMDDPDSAQASATETLAEVINRQ
jgi:hypothetical protein